MNGKKVTQQEIGQIIELRKTGHSLPEIRKIVGRGSSTVFKHIKDVEILPKFIESWESKRWSSKLKKTQQEEKAKFEAIALVPELTGREKILIAASLYWAEGAKGDFSLLNSDPDLIKTFIRALQELGINKDRIIISVRVFDDLEVEKSCLFWSKLIGIPRSRIKSVNILKGKKNGKLPYGMCRIRVSKGGYYLKLMKAIRGVIKDKI